MAIPVGVPRVTVTTGLPLMAPGGTPVQGKILFIGPDLVVVPDLDLTLDGAEPMPLVDGLGSVDLVPSDLRTMNPAGWPYEVRSAFSNAPNWVRWIRLTSGMSTVKLSDVLVPDPVSGAFTVLIDPSTLGTAAFADIGTAAGKVAAGTTLATATTHADQGDVQTLTAAKLYTDQHAGGGGAGADPTREVEVFDDPNLTPHPLVTVWTVVATPLGTALRVSIPAVVGDRLEVFLAAGRRGSSAFYDVALLDGDDGTPAVFAARMDGQPSIEGNITMYSSLSIQPVSSPPQFTVGAEHLDGEGNASVAMVYIGGGGDGFVYLHPDYRARLRVKRIGAEPEAP